MTHAGKPVRKTASTAVWAAPAWGAATTTRKKTTAGQMEPAQEEKEMTDRTISIFSINDVLDALSMVPEGSAEDLASELTGLSIDSIWELSGKEYIVTDIEWEMDGEDVSLPAACIIKAHDESEIADRLSDRYGWLIRNLDVKELDISGQPDNYAHALQVLFDEGWNYYGAAELLEEVDVKSVSDMELIALSENYRAR